VIQQTAIEQCFQSWKRWCEWCIAAQRNWYEEDNSNWAVSSEIYYL
jgi:hypothetical protein